MGDDSCGDADAVRSGAVRHGLGRARRGQFSRGEADKDGLGPTVVSQAAAAKVTLATGWDRIGAAGLDRRCREWRDTARFGEVSHGRRG